MKIGYYLGKLWVRFLVSFLLTHGVESPTRARTDRFSDIIADRSNIKATAVFRRYFFIFTARAMIASRVCLSARLSQVRVLLKRLNVRSRKQSHTIAHGL